MSVLRNPITQLKGLGPAKAAILEKDLEIKTYQDLLQFYPYRYIDRSRFYKISDLKSFEQEVQTVGEVIGLRTIPQKRGKRLEVTLKDDTGTISLTWFKGFSWIESSIKTNIPYVIFGKISIFNNVLHFIHPEIEPLDKFKQKSILSSTKPLYTASEKLIQKGVNNRLLSKIIEQALMESIPHIKETLPDYLLKKLNLITSKEAYTNIHFPKNSELLSKAVFRLKFEEFFFLQLRLIEKNISQKKKTKGHLFFNLGSTFNDFYHNYLPFELTNAQKRVIKEIRNDMKTGAQMNRLLQGDVGSGKTIVALMVCLIAIGNGFQTCIMAPTEVLAEQHYQSFLQITKDLNIRISKLTGSTKSYETKEILENLETGETSLIVGTHSLLENRVVFKNLGLVIVDEQHKFGVAQRLKLWLKNNIPPHILVMTATPIPRTLAMTAYGDLDISILDELPSGRKPIQTFHYKDSNRLKVFRFLKQQITLGKQAYIVYPLIEESDSLEYKNLMDGYESLVREFPPPKYKIGVVHGQMKPMDKYLEMERFIKGETHILVSTTVIEVGVNVPNASTMVIESAQKFGLSQLHQLRGRVGRGADQSYCILMTDYKLSDNGKERINAMVETSDGFKISEVDLKLRGPGDILGTRQSGLLNFKIANLLKDQKILMLARQQVALILNSDPELKDPKNESILRVLKNLSNQNIWSFIS